MLSPLAASCANIRAVERRIKLEKANVNAKDSYNSLPEVLHVVVPSPLSTYARVL